MVFSSFETDRQTRSTTPAQSYRAWCFFLSVGLRYLAAHSSISWVRVGVMVRVRVRVRLRVERAGAGTNRLTAGAARTPEASTCTRVELEDRKD